MTTVERNLLRSSGEPRQRASRRTDVVTAVLSAWVVLGLFLDAWAHVNVPELETFFTPWHAVFYSGFAAVAAWVLTTVARQVRRGRRGAAAVPLGYGPTLVALPVFVLSGLADMAWHTVLGIETTVDIFFSPSHLGLLVALVVIVTSPLRSAWADPERLTPPWSAVVTLGFAGTLVLLFLTYANALTFDARRIVVDLSDLDGGGTSRLAARIAVTNLVLLAPLLLLARHWRLPFGAATVLALPAILLSTLLQGFANPSVVAAVVLGAVLTDVLARWLRPTSARRGAYWAFAAASALVTWGLYVGLAALAVGRLPAVASVWTGVPVVAAMLGWAFAALMLPTAVPERVVGASG